MKFPWFQRIGVFFRPVAVMGWIIFISAIVYSVYVFMEIDKTSHSASDTLIRFAFNLLIVGVTYSLGAFLTSRVN